MHTGGEEFLVLGGVFQDEHGDYPVGSYVRNPPQSRHTPRSANGCVILVKLWQFDLNDRTQVRSDINKLGRVRDATRAGVAVTPLYADQYETVQIEQWLPGAAVTVDASGGAELFVLAGGAGSKAVTLRQGSWLRLPLGGDSELVAGPDGITLWLKTGHLRSVQGPAV